MPKTYSQTRDRIQVYFDQTAVKAWEALTNESPVSAIRSKVRAGRQEMRELLLSRLPKDLTDYSDGKEMRTLHIPIKFWFCGNSGMALPLVNLLYSKVKITVELNNASNVYLTTPSHYIGVNNDIVNLKQFEYIEQTVNNTKSIGIYIGHDIYEKKLYYIKVSGENFKGIP